MKKKRSNGVAIFGVFLFVYGAVIISFIQSFMLDRSFSDLVYNLGYAVWVPIFIFLVLGIFNLQNWARLIWLWGSILFLIWGWVCVFASFNPLGVKGLGGLCYIIYPTGFGIPAIIFLTRPKVKEQFRQANVPGGKCDT